MLACLSPMQHSRPSPPSRHYWCLTHFRHKLLVSQDRLTDNPQSSSNTNCHKMLAHDRSALCHPASHVGVHGTRTIVQHASVFSALVRSRHSPTLASAPRTLRSVAANGSLVRLDTIQKFHSRIHQNLLIPQGKTGDRQNFVKVGIRRCLDCNSCDLRPTLIERKETVDKSKSCLL